MIEERQYRAKDRVKKRFESFIREGLRGAWLTWLETYFDKEELKNGIKNLLESAEINIVNNTEGYDDCFITSNGAENKVNRPAFVDKYGNCLVQGYREVKKKE